jgi:hypothetical protein
MRQRGKRGTLELQAKPHAMFLLNSVITVIVCSVASQSTSNLKTGRVQKPDLMEFAMKLMFSLVSIYLGTIMIRLPTHLTKIRA